jgi:hypothetical protein
MSKGDGDAMCQTSRTVLANRPQSGVERMIPEAKRACAAVLSAAMVMAPVAASAQAPGSVRDLVGARAAGGEDQLEFRGFSRISGHIEDNSKINYWWNSNTKECVKVVT